MREALLLWLFVVLILFTIAIAVLLALGVVFGAVWLFWRGCLAVAALVDAALTGEEVKTNVSAAGRSIEPRLSGRVREPRAGRLVRVQAGLVPASPCLAQRDLGRLERRRQAGSRPGDE